MTEFEENLKLELFKMAAHTRNMEIALFWQRSNYFLVLNTAIAVGYFSLKNPIHALLFSIMGICISGLWVAVNLGSKFWQLRWDYRLLKLEENLQPGIDIFSANWETVQSEVTYSFSLRKRGWVHDIYKKCVMLKPSVTLMMTVLSAFFVIFWAVAASLSFL